MNVTNLNENDYRELQNIVSEMFEKFVFTKTTLSPEQLEKELLNYAKKIVQLNLKKDNLDMSSINVLKIDDRKSKNVNGFMRYSSNPKKPSTMHLNISKLINGTNNKGFYSKSTNVRLKTLTRFIETIQHEYRHNLQNLAVCEADDRVGYSLSEKYIMSREKASLGIKREFFYKLKDNYKNYYTESDARLAGKTESLMICKPSYLKAIDKVSKGQLKGISIENINEDIFDRTVSRETNDLVMSNDMNFFKARGNRNKITSNATDFAIACNKDLLKKYPYLKIEYNKDGSRKIIEDITQSEKELLQLYPNQNNEVSNLFDMIYSDVFIHKMTKEETQELAKRLSKDDMNDLLQRCENYNSYEKAKNINDLTNLTENSKRILANNTFSMSSKYKKYIENINYNIFKKYDDTEKRIEQKYNIVRKIQPYKSKKEIVNSRTSSRKDNVKFKNSIRIIKYPAMALYKISEIFSKEKKERRTIAPETLRTRKLFNYENSYMFDEDIDLDKKLEELRELKEEKKQKSAILLEAKDCFKESEKYADRLNLKNIDDINMGKR